MTTKEIELWRGPFGTQYAERNTPSDEDVKQRTFWWETILRQTYALCHTLPDSVLEVGAGVGQNLMAISAIGRQIERRIDLYATEVNDNAREALQINVPGVQIIGASDLGRHHNIADMVFTSGVLIHVHPAHRLNLMRDMYSASKRFIFCAEYFAPQTRPLDYRGEKAALWLDDYGSFWLDNFKLRSVTYGFAWKKTTGLDNLTWHLFEKVD